MRTTEMSTDSRISLTVTGLCVNRTVAQRSVVVGIVVSNSIRPVNG